MQSITIEKYAGCKRISYTAHNEPKLFMKSQLYVCQYGNSTRFATHFTVNHALKICIKKHSWRHDDKEIKCDFKKDLTPNCSTLQRQFIKISELLEQTHSIDTSKVHYLCAHLKTISCRHIHIQLQYVTRQRITSRK